ncbi:MAG: hypothetical protein KDH94_05655 [Coxiellaceae bacterium]|nr:hypothetical protein [Coxiellaceae bacterium]
MLSPHGTIGVRCATRAIKKALSLNHYNDVIRADIKGYYASIDREILLSLLHQHYQDPRLRNYFEQIVRVKAMREDAANSEVTQTIVARSTGAL